MLHEGKVGSITRTVDMNGSVRNEYDYGTFGTRSHVKTAGTGSNQNFGYTGEMLDAESGLLYLRARYYDPSIGRFISADTYLGRMAEPVTQNRYIYVHNNPLLFVDPSGNNAFDFVDGVNSVGEGFVDYLKYTASLSGLHGEERQSEVQGFVRTYESIMQEIISNPGTAANMSADIINQAHQDRPSFLYGRGLAGPGTSSILGPIGGGGFSFMAANGDAMRAIENGATSAHEILQSSLLGEPWGGQCTGTF